MRSATRRDRASGADEARGTSREPRLLAAITAAGASQRMGRSKALLPLRGSTVLAEMVRTMRRAGLARPAVVIGAHRDEVLAEVRRLGAFPLENPHHAAGRFTSVALAARWALGQVVGRPSLLLWPIDCPGVSRQTVSRLCDASARHPEADLVPTCGDRGGHPVVLCWQTLTTVAAHSNDGNLRELIGRSAGGRRAITVDDPAVLDNLNTPEDYEAFVNRVHRAGTTGTTHA